MTNHATEADLAAYLEQQGKDVGERIARAGSAVIAKAAKLGALDSSGRIIQSMQSVETALHEWIVELIELSANWNGPNLSDQLVRQRHCEAFRQALTTHVTAPRGRWQSAGLENMAEETRKRLESKIRTFELGVVRPAESTPSTVYNIVHAANITGGVQQAGGDATQTNTVTLTTGEIETAIDRLTAVLDQHGLADLQKELEPDLATIQIQLKKSEPDPTILQAAGKSVRTMIEGAIGGAVGGAATPAVVHAATMLGAALGLA